MRKTSQHWMRYWQILSDRFGYRLPAQPRTDRVALVPEAEISASGPDDRVTSVPTQIVRFKTLGSHLCIDEG